MEKKEETQEYIEWKEERDKILQKPKRKPLFLGRTEFDSNRIVYTFEDGTGAVPEEMKREIEGMYGIGSGAITILTRIWDWKERLGLK